MMKSIQLYFSRTALFAIASVLFMACSDDDAPTPPPPGGTDKPVLLVIDEESIDNNAPPNYFSATDINDHIAEVGNRTPLPFFQSNAGDTIQLFTGQVGDEGWFALKTIPNSWKSAGPGTNGAKNFWHAGEGLGTGDDPEILLDEIPDVTPLRATGLAMLKGQTVVAVIYDSDISINYGPLEGNLQGANLGIAAFTVLEVTKRTGGSDSDLPVVTIRMENVLPLSAKPFYLFSNAPVPLSSSEPEDIVPPANPGTPVLSAAP